MGVARTATLARPHGVLSPFFVAGGLPSLVATSLNPPVFGTSAVKYHTLPVAIQSPSHSWFIGDVRSSIHST